MPKNGIQHSPLQVILEGKIFEEQQIGGISRIYHEILPRICTMDERISFSIPTFGQLMQSVPHHPQITRYSSGVQIYRLLRPQTVFWHVQDYLRAKLQISSIHLNKNTIWHATYFQLPAWWAGPKVTTVYDLIHEKFPHNFNKNYDNMLRKRKERAVFAADKVICISESVRSEIIEMYDLPQERVVAIPLACGDNFRQMSKEEISSDFRVDRPFILYVGMRQHYKNFKTLLRAYAAWPRRNQVALLVVGDPWSEEEHGEIRGAGLESNITFRSGIADEELCALYNQALAFVYPSLAEGFGIPLLEAMACGCPIVASRIPIFMEVARDIPYFFDPSKKDELISALEAACFSEKALDRSDAILANYSWERTARATLEIYRELALCN
ncbi:MAG: glycosyltransferase family 4 protein [Anaerolineales bacterium]